jgi:hypothetical protein
MPRHTQAEPAVGQAAPGLRRPAHRRQKKRGAALTEALVVSLLITIFLGAIWFFHELNAHKGETLRQARYQAWAATRPACDGTSVRGGGTRVAQVPSTMRTGGLAPSSMPVTSSTEMACNVRPEPNSDFASVFGSISELFSAF